MSTYLIQSRVFHLTLIFFANTIDLVHKLRLRSYSQKGWAKIILVISTIVIIASVALFIYKIVSILTTGKQVAPQGLGISPIFQQGPNFKTLAATNSAVLKVGQETIYGNTYNHLANTYFKQALLENDQNLQNQVLEKLASGSATLQIAIANKNLTPNPTIYNSLYLDPIERQKVIGNLTLQYSQNEPKISGQGIKIVFQNVAPTMPIEEADTLAKKIIESIYNDVKAGKLTFEQAASTLVANSDIAKLDPNYKNHISYSVSATPGQDLFSEESVNQVASKLPLNTLSPLIRYPQTGSPELNGVGYYTFFKLDTKPSKDQNLDTLINQFLQENKPTKP